MDGPTFPIICASIVSENDGSHLLKTVDTSGQKHDMQYLSKLAKTVIDYVTQEFGVKVRSFVTDNAANMKAMRRELKKDCGDVITYGCSSHYANLLAHNLDIPNVRNHVVQIVKHVRNNHSAAASFKEAGGPKLVMPVETRWNSLSDCLESYLKQWLKLASVDLEPAIAAKVNDMGIKNNAKDLLSRLKPVSTALDKLQSDSCKISDAVGIWKSMLVELKNLSLPKDVGTRSSNVTSKPYLIATSLLSCSIPNIVTNRWTPRKNLLRCHWLTRNFQILPTYIGKHES
jgi:hypothetical protein